MESDFCKLLNNANFGYDCRNNLDNCTFEPINDEINESSFIKRYNSNLYDRNLQPFITSRILKEEIDERFNNERQKIKETDKFYAAKIKLIISSLLTLPHLLDCLIFTRNAMSIVLLLQMMGGWGIGGGWLIYIRVWVGGQGVVITLVFFFLVLLCLFCHVLSPFI